MTLAQTPCPDSERTMRPWGSWQVLDTGAGFKVRQITVAPRRRLSLQAHVHRSEHWIIVAGRATCTVARRRFTADVGERVEVQLGSYTGEDDVIGLADDYAR